MSLRIYLTGRVEVEADEASETLIPSSRFPGRQGRRAFAYLVCERGRMIPRAELADAIWDEGALPSAWDAALSALVSKLRRLLAGAGEGRAGTIATEAGGHELRLAPGAWVDIEAAAAAAEQAEAGLRAGRPHDAWGHATVAVSIARRPFLPGEEGTWIDHRRANLRSMLVRGLEAFADAALAIGDPAQAERTAADLVGLEPFRETCYQRLMRAHAAAGNRAEALRVYERCRSVLEAELGVDPSSGTERLYLEILRA